MIKRILFIFMLLIVSLDYLAMENTEKSVAPTADARFYTIVTRYGWDKYLELRIELEKNKDFKLQEAYTFLIEKEAYKILDIIYPAFERVEKSENKHLNFFDKLENLFYNPSPKNIKEFDKLYFEKYPELKPILLYAKQLFNPKSYIEQTDAMLNVAQLLKSSSNNELIELGRIYDGFAKTQRILIDLTHVLTFLLFPHTPPFIQKFVNFMKIFADKKYLNLDKLRSIIIERKKELLKENKIYSNLVRNSQLLKDYYIPNKLMPSELFTKQELAEAEKKVNEIESTFTAEEPGEFKKRNQKIEAQQKRAKNQRKRAKQRNRRNQKSIKNANTISKQEARAAAADQKISQSSQERNLPQDTLTSTQACGARPSLKGQINNNNPIQVLINQHNTYLKSLCVELKESSEEIIEISKWIIKIKKGNSLFTIYNLAGNESHLDSQQQILQFRYHDHVQRWHLKPQETTQLLNSIQPEKQQNQILRHTFPKALLACFRNLAKQTEAIDEHGNHRYTIYHWGKLESGDFKFEGLFVTGFNPADNTVYHQYFIPKSFQAILEQEISSQDIKEFIESYKKEEFPSLKYLKKK